MKGFGRSLSTVRDSGNGNSNLGPVSQEFQQVLPQGLPQGLFFSQRNEPESPASSVSDRGERQTSSAGAQKSGCARLSCQRGCDPIAVIFGIGRGSATRRRSRLINPDSPFAQGVTIISCFLLLYTAVITPVAVAFFWENDACEPLPTLPFDMFLDTFFMAEIVYTFFVGISIQGIYLDSVREVGWHYFRTGSLFFDLLTSIPVAIIEYASLQACASVDDATATTSGATIGLRFIRIIKPLRLLKLLRIVKTMKILQMMDWVESVLRPPPLLFRMLRITFAITMIVHICASAWWLTKELSAGLDTYGELDLDPDAPLWRKYVISVYFINTIFTTVGFGDIAAENPAEQIFCVIIMYVGVLVFGTLLAEVQTVVGELRRKTRERNQVKQQLMWYLRAQDVPPSLEYKIMRWVDFDIGCMQDAKAEKLCLQHIPQTLKEEVMQYVHGVMLDNVDFFNEHCVQWPSEALRRVVTRELATCLTAATFCEKEKMFRLTQPQGLYIIVEGEVAAYCKGLRLTVHTAGDFFGEQSLLEASEQTEAADPDRVVRLKARTNVRCMLLPREAFAWVMSAHPSAKKRIYAHIRQRVNNLSESYPLLRWTLMVSKLQRQNRLANQSVASLCSSPMAQTSGGQNPRDWLFAGARDGGGGLGMLCKKPKRRMSHDANKMEAAVRRQSGSRREMERRRNSEISWASGQDGPQSKRCALQGLPSGLSASVTEQESRVGSNGSEIAAAGHDAESKSDEPEAAPPSQLPLSIRRMRSKHKSGSLPALVHPGIVPAGGQADGVAAESHEPPRRPHDSVDSFLSASGECVAATTSPPIMAVISRGSSAPGDGLASSQLSELTGAVSDLAEQMRREQQSMAELRAEMRQGLQQTAAAQAELRDMLAALASQHASTRDV